MEGGFDFSPRGMGNIFGNLKSGGSGLVKPLLPNKDDDDTIERGTTSTDEAEEMISESLTEAATLASKLAKAIETIFNYYQPEGQGGLTASTISGANTLSALGLGDLGDALVGFGTDSVTASKVREIIFTRKQRSWIETIALKTLIWVMPFLYTIVTRLPFICLPIEVQVRNGQFWNLALVLGLYQSCRSIANGIISKFGGVSPIHRLHIPMVCLSIAGWVLVNDQIIPASSDNPLWLLFLCLVGLSECILNLQTAVANETAAEYPSGIADKSVLEGRIRGQYAAVAGGAAVAFIAGGQLYTAFGFAAICWFGLAFSVTHLCLAIFYRPSTMYKYKVPLEGGGVQSSLKSCYQIIALSWLIKEAKAMEEQNVTMSGRLPLDVLVNLATKAKADKVLNKALKELYKASHTAHKSALEGRDTGRDDMFQTLYECSLKLMDVNSDGEVSLKEFVSFLGPRIYYEIHGDVSNQVDVVWPYMHFVVATQAIVAFCIGSFLSTALLMYTQRFKLDAAQSGLLLGIGEGLACASIFLAYFLKKRSEKRGPTNSPGGVFAAMKSRPLHVPITVGIVAIGTMCFSVPVLGVAIAAQMLMSTFNDVSVSYLNELIATSVPPSKFRKNQGRGQYLRRIGNVITGVTGPLLFGVYEGLPFILFGSIVFVWSLILFVAIYRHASKMERATKGKASWGFIGPFMATSSTPWHQLEKEYYVQERETIIDELGDEDAVTADIPELKITVKRLTASLELEKEKLKAVEEELQELKSGRV